MKLRGKSIGSQKCAHGKASGPSKRTILIAGMGTSPAVLTETVWALTHQETPVVPDEIVVITTKLGKESLHKAIMSGEPSVWERLKTALRKEKIAIDGRLVFGDTKIRVIPDEKGDEADDLRNGTDNMRAADFMLHELRAYTDESDTTVLCSIAGGRKTMSALLFSCMTLVGREQDKVYHVLIPPEYDGNNLKPLFYFPQKGEPHEVFARGVSTGKTVLSSEICIELFEVPFVRMRGWYEEKFSKKQMPGYKTLVDWMQSTLPPAEAYPEILIDAYQGSVKVDGHDVSLSNNELAVLILAANGCPRERMAECLLAASMSESDTWCKWLDDFKINNRMGNEKTVKGVLSRVANELRNALKDAGFVNCETLVPSGRKHVSYPLDRIQWLNRKKLKDICGYLFPVAAK